MASIACIQRFAPAVLIVLLPSAALWIHDDAATRSSDPQRDPNGRTSTGVFLRPDAEMSEILRALPDEDCTFEIDANTGELSFQIGRAAIPHFDIKPGQCPNRFKVKREGGVDEGSGGPAPAMVAQQLGTGVLGNGFDVTQVDLGSLQLTRAHGTNAPGNQMTSVNLFPTSIEFSDKGTPFIGPVCDCHALGADGKLDLNLEFDEPSIIEAFQLENVPDGTLVQLTLFGRTSPSGGFRIRDCIQVWQ
jgi:hypothetical protein